ncbi:MAG: MFS transporter [Thermoleophilia bacterium]|nr:MFS transporter [Thermoleophilia bacterium]
MPSCLMRRLRAHLPPLLAERAFRRFWTGQSISMFGDQVTLLAIPLVAVLVLDAGPTQMGLLTAAGMLPHLLFAVWFGTVLDRHGRRRQAMIMADVLRAALLLSIPIAAVMGGLTLPHLYGVAFTIGMLDALFYVACGTLFVSLVSSDQYLSGASLLAGSRATAQVAGQGIAGVLIGILTAPVVLALDALTFLVSAICMGSIRPVEPAVDTSSNGRIMAGLRFIRRSPYIRAALGATSILNFFNYMFVAVFVLFATTELGLRPGVLGIVLGCAAIGAFVATTVTGRIGARLGLGRSFVLGCLLFQAPLVLVPLATGSQHSIVAMLLIAEFAAGFGVMVLDISASAIFAAAIPDELRARVTGAYLTMNYGVRPLGALAGGALGSAIGLRDTLLVATLGGLVGVLLAWRSQLWNLVEVDRAAPVAEVVEEPDVPASVPERVAASR